MDRTVNKEEPQSRDKHPTVTDRTVTTNVPRLFLLLLFIIVIVIYCYWPTFVSPEIFIPLTSELILRNRIRAYIIVMSFSIFSVNSASLKDTF